VASGCFQGEAKGCRLLAAEIAKSHPPATAAGSACESWLRARREPLLGLAAPGIRQPLNQGAGILTACF